MLFRSDSAINGQDYYGSDGTRAHSVDGLFGGQDIYGDGSGFSVDSPFGGSEIFINSEQNVSFTGDSE